MLDTPPNAGLRRGDGDVAPAFMERRSTHRKLEATAEIDTGTVGPRKAAEDRGHLSRSLSGEFAL